jgi:nucleoid DNA-binding protein
MDIMQQVLDGIVEILVAERRIELRNFGVFEVRRRKARRPAIRRPARRWRCPRGTS